MDKKGDVLTDFALVGFYLMFAAALGISLLIFTENVKQKTDFYQEKDAVDIATSLNIMPLASGKLEIKSSTRPEFTYAIKDGKVIVTKKSEKIKNYVTSSYSANKIEKIGETLILKNE